MSKQKNKDKFVVWEIYCGQDSIVIPRFLVINQNTKRKFAWSDDIRTAQNIADDLNRALDAVRGVK